MARLLTPADDLVAAEMRRWAALPFVWGESCCAMSVLDYVERATGRKLVKRPTYTSVHSAARLSMQHGGFYRYCIEIMAELGCARTSSPRRGDVGLCDLPGSGLTACLCLGAKWAARAERSVVIAPAEPVSAWEVVCPRR